MNPILVYGFPSGSSMGLVAAMEWLQQPYQLCRVDMFGQMREPDYRRINARVETPAFVTDQGMVLTETMAIAAWLETRDHNRKISFAPLDPRTDRMHQMMAFINTGFTGAFSPLWAAMEMEDGSPDMQLSLRQWGEQCVIKRHMQLEELLGNSTFALCDHPTLADALLIGVARWADIHLRMDPARCPRLARVRARLEADQAVAYAAAVEAGESRKGNGACRGHIDLEEVISRFGSRAPE